MHQAAGAAQQARQSIEGLSTEKIVIRLAVIIVSNPLLQPAARRRFAERPAISGLLPRPAGIFCYHQAKHRRNARRRNRVGGGALLCVAYTTAGRSGPPRGPGGQPGWLSVGVARHLQCVTAELPVIAADSANHRYLTALTRLLSHNFLYQC